MEGEGSADLLCVVYPHLVDAVVDLPGSPNGSQVVVLMGPGHPEEGDDRIADVLLDEAVIPEDYGGYFSEDMGCDLFDLFGIESLGHGGVAREVGEKDGDMPALGLPRRHVPRNSGQGDEESLAALIAKLAAGEIGPATSGADRLQLGAAFAAELGTIYILEAALRAFHRTIPPFG